jgi:hypothetical protein
MRSLETHLACPSWPVGSATDQTMPKKKQPGLVALSFRIRTELAQTIALADRALCGFVNTSRARHSAQHGLALRPRLLLKAAP